MPACDDLGRRVRSYTSYYYQIRIQLTSEFTACGFFLVFLQRKWFSMCVGKLSTPSILILLRLVSSGNWPGPLEV
jgi:hypothetical protein